MRKYKILRPTATILAIVIFFQSILPYKLLALTEGPNQPEAKGFQAVEASNLVDLASGDFKYNISLCDVGGYPLNLSYQSGNGADDESSWVGHGWTLNPGYISRTMRGLPDDFKGDTITRRFNMKEDQTWGVSPGVSAEIFGIGLGANAGFFYNSYKGWGFEAGLSPSLKIGSKNGTENTSSLNISGSFSYNSQSGIGLGGGIGFTSKNKSEYKKTTSLNFGGYNSRQGLKELNWGLSSSRKRETEISSLGMIGGSISFGTPTYTPVADLPIENNSYSLHGTVGGDFFGVHPNVTLNAYNTSQKTKTRFINRPAYGYQYSESGYKNPLALQDYNRDKPTPYKTELVNISPVIGTYDLFNVTSQNGGGQFRLYRNDVGYYGEVSKLNLSSGNSVGIELGAGNLFHGGFDLNMVNTNTSSTKWSEDNVAKDRIDFKSKIKDKDNSEVTLEPAYFRMTEENTKLDAAFADKYAKYTASRIKIAKSGNKVIAELYYTKEANLVNSGNLAMSNTMYKANRQARNTVITALTAREARYTGHEKEINAYSFNTFFKTNCNESSIINKKIDRATYSFNHYSEFNVVNNDGSRNVYGIPVYNKSQKEVTFSVDKSKANTNTGMVAYANGIDDSASNQLGEDNYYNSEETPAYATNFLLTAIMSADYADRTLNGISPDDPGTAVKFNYSVVENYKWRTPYVQDSARYIPGNRSDNTKTDDKGSYVYGIKDVWYLHSIESNTEVAHFYTSNRNDGLGVAATNGVKETNSSYRLKRLDSIKIYSKFDVSVNGSNAIPIKTIVFEYESTNTLWKGNLPNTVNPSTEGKLTLKRIYTKYFKNNVSYNDYRFGYRLPSVGEYPNYNANQQDRWGCYRNISTVPNPGDFPYTYQNQAHAQLSSELFNLNQITLPSGGIITVGYEPDDYAYVQDKRAGQMMFIRGFKGTGTLNSNLYTNHGTVHDTLIIDLPYQVVNGSNAINEIKQRYFKDVDQLYFNFYVDINGTGSKEYVSGYMDYNSSGIGIYELNGGNVKAIKIPITKLTTDDGVSIHPVTKAALQLMRLNIQRLAFPASFSGNIFKQMVGFIGDVGILIKGFDRKFVNDGFCKTVEIGTNKSWIRLANPNYAKYGGGSRVKNIALSDIWNTMDATGETASYTQAYTYTTKETIAGVEQDISSGVASWEPALGNEENLFRTPLPYKQEVKLGPDNSFYTENPIGEGLFPSASVVYREVKVRNTTSRVDNSSNGYMVYKHYTAKEFPTIVSRTKKETIPQKSNPLLKIFKIYNFNFETVSQGFVVEVNNMHGKLKEEASYNESGSLIAYTRYEYKTNQDNSITKKLDNTIPTIASNGNVSNLEMGVKVDIWQDFSEESTNTEGNGVAFNTEGFMAFIFPVVLPIPIPIIQREKVRLRWSSTTKFISRNGILTKITKMQDGSILSTDNLYWDSETGDVVINSIDDEYGKKIYQTNYPAHWAYANIGFAYENVDLEAKNVVYDVNNGFTSGTFVSKLVEGDEIQIAYSVGLTGYEFIIPGRYFIGVNSSNTTKFIIDQNGNQYNPLSAPLNVKVLRSGKRNMLNTQVYQYSSIQNPVISNSLTSSTNPQILNASGTHYKPDWAVEPILKEKPICTKDSSLTNTIFFKDTILRALLDIDQHWLVKASQNVNLLQVIQAKYPSFVDKIWDGKLLSQTSYYVEGYAYGGYNPYLYIDFQAKIGENKKLYIESGDLCCILPLKKDDHISEMRISAAVSCNPFDVRYLRKPTQAGTSCDSTKILKLVSDSMNTCCFYALLERTTCNKSTCVSLANNDIINPFVLGSMSNWRPYRQFVYHTSRQSNDIINTGSSIFQDGYFKNYQHLYTFSGNGIILNPSLSTSLWDTSITITKYNTRGQELENYNAINIPSSAWYGYDKNLVSIVAQNAKLKNVAFDGVEDWGFNNTCNSDTCYSQGHFDFYTTPSSYNNRTNSQAHSGKYSIIVTSGSTVSECTTYGNPIDGIYDYNAPFTYPTTVAPYYKIQSAGILPTFSPDPGLYVVSAWVKKATIASSGSIELISGVCCGGTSTTRTFNPSGPIVEGWQRIFDTITINSSLPCAGSFRSLKVNLKATGGNVYFDDFRMHPLDANIKSHVYDHITRRLIATLDENNYASFYEYDDAGNLVRVKKETERGIKTIKESRNYLKTEN